MGMDLVGIKKDTYFQTNWTGWRVLRLLLNELKCDTSEISGENDGAIVPKETCIAWYVAIIEYLAVDKIKNLFIPDTNYGRSGGYNRLVNANLYKDNIDELEPLSMRDTDWLKEFCTFLIGCNGFRQY
jgi:hypothetical protein